MRNDFLDCSSPGRARDAGCLHFRNVGGSASLTCLTSKFCIKTWEIGSNRPSGSGNRAGINQSIFSPHTRTASGWVAPACACLSLHTYSICVHNAQAVQGLIHSFLRHMCEKLFNKTRKWSEYTRDHTFCLSST